MTLLTVTLERTGAKVEHIESYSLDSDYLTSTDGFEFEAYQEGERRKELFGLELEPVHLEIDGASQVNGRIEVSGPGSGLSRKLQGRDYFAEMVESHVDPTMAVVEGDLLGNVIKQAAAPVGITRVLTPDQLAMRDVRAGLAIGATVVPFNAPEIALGKYKPNPGEGTYEFLTRICARAGCVMQPTTSRDAVLLSKPNYNQPVTYQLTRMLSGNGNNIISGEARRDFSSFPSLFIASGKGGAAAEARTNLSKLYKIGILAEEFNRELGEIFTEHTIDERLPPGTVGDPLKLYRLHVYNDEQARNQFQVENSSLRRLSELLRNTLTYTCSVPGHRYKDGPLYAIDTIAHVRDEVENLDEPLWIYGRTFTYSAKAGAMTNLRMWRPATFQI